MQLQIEPLLMSKHSEPVILGFAYFVIDDKYFPFEKWIDNLSFLMSNWLEKIYMPKSIFHFTFMEGPYGFYIENNGESSELLFYEGHPKNYKEIFSLKVDFEKFKQLLFDTACQYVIDAEKNGFEDRELIDLKEFLKSLENK